MLTPFQKLGGSMSFRGSTHALTIFWAAGEEQGTHYYQDIK